MRPPGDSLVTWLGKLAIVAAGLAGVGFLASQYWNLNRTLVEAAGRGGVERVALLLSLGLNVDASVSGRTALMAAAESGSEATMRLLVERGADPAVRDDDGNTALVRAARLGATRNVKILLDRGAHAEQDVDRALAAAIGHGYADAALLLRRAEVSSAGRVLALVTAARRGSVQVALDLIDEGADVNGRDPSGRTALMHGFAGLLEELLAAGADVNLQDAEGSTALMHATRRRQLRDVRLLLERGADPNRANRNGETPLMLAVEQRDPNVATALLDGGADPNARNRWAETPLYLARYHRDPALQQAISQRGGAEERDPWKRTLAPWMRDPLMRVDSVRDDELRRATAEGVLYDAVLGRQAAVVRTLLDRGTDVNAIRKDGDTVLIAAIDHGSTDLVNLLLDRGASPNLAGRHGFTPLMRAVAVRSVPMAQLLVERGANLDATKEGGSTALCIAERMERPSREIARVLRRAGARESTCRPPWDPAS